MIFLLQEAIGALDAALIGTRGMISGQGAPCFSNCKVKVIWTTSPPATYTITTWLACHPRCKHSLQAMLPYIATIFATAAESMLYLGAECSDCFVCLSG